MTYSRTSIGRANKRKHRQSRKNCGAEKERRRRSENKAQRIIASHKASGCVFCGEKFGPALDMHHVDSNTKKGHRDTASSAKTRAKAFRIADETVPVCATCHRKLHHGFFGPRVNEALKAYLEVRRRKEAEVAVQIDMFPKPTLELTVVPNLEIARLASQELARRQSKKSP